MTTPVTQKPARRPAPRTPQLSSGDTEWMRHGACVGMDPTLFDTDVNPDATEAQQVCQRCVVRTSCLFYALTHKEFCVWGGTDDAYRAELHAWNRAAAKVRKKASR